MSSCYSATTKPIQLRSSKFDGKPQRFADSINQSHHQVLTDFRLLNGELIHLNNSRYEGGNPEQTALLIKDASRNDAGSYTCELENSIALGTSENDIDVLVWCKGYSLLSYIIIVIQSFFFCSKVVPTVDVSMDPDDPVVEDDRANVTLICNVIEGNPANLTQVRWYHDDQLIEDVPDCTKEDEVESKTESDQENYDEENDDDDDDDDRLKCGFYRLINIDRNSMGNYSCEGQNPAGWGPRSEGNNLVVHYEPGNATLVHFPLVAIKKKSVTLTCSVEDGGNPIATRYRWLRGGLTATDVVTPVWTVDPVGLDSRTNFTCFAHNEGGSGIPATIQLDVHAPQTFITKLAPYTGVLYTAQSVSLSCRVECVPECRIDWYRESVKITPRNPRYFVLATDIPADPAVGDFESISSVLHFNVTAWPGGHFDWLKDNANYSCSSSSATDGPGVKSTTLFAVECELCCLLNLMKII